LTGPRREKNLTSSSLGRGGEKTVLALRHFSRGNRLIKPVQKRRGKKARLIFLARREKKELSLARPRKKRA